jgi:hypothetical protein
MPTAAKVRTPAKPRLYVKNQITGRWKAEIETGRSCKFFSPYVTGRGARNILLAAGSKQVELYTLFTLENFASDGSSLDCIEQLVKAGLTVYHLPGLHAKILLMPGRAVTIGSQNLTARGTVNREANLLVSDSAMIQRVEEETAAWLTDRVPVTQPWIDDMRRQLRGVRNLFRKAKADAARLNEEVMQRERERVERERQERERERQEAERQRRLSNLRAAVGSLRVASTVVSTRMQYTTPAWHSSADESLFALSGRSLTRWYVDGRVVELQDCYRYLCIIEDTGKMGWARVASSRISFVEPSVEYGERLHYRTRSWHVIAEGHWGDSTRSMCNLTLKLESSWGEEARLDCWFSVSGLEVEKVVWRNPPRHEVVPKHIAKSIADNDEALRDKLTNYLVRPFKYKDGQKLGTRSDKFFGGYGSRYRISLAKVSQHEVLIARQGS